MTDSRADLIFLSTLTAATAGAAGAVRGKPGALCKLAEPGSRSGQIARISAFATYRAPHGSKILPKEPRLLLITTLHRNPQSAPTRCRQRDRFEVVDSGAIEPQEIVSFAHNTPPGIREAHPRSAVSPRVVLKRCQMSRGRGGRFASGGRTRCPVISCLPESRPTKIGQGVVLKLVEYRRREYELRWAPRTRPSQNYVVNVQISQATSDHTMTTITTARAAPKA